MRCANPLVAKATARSTAIALKGRVRIRAFITMSGYQASGKPQVAIRRSGIDCWKACKPCAAHSCSPSFTSTNQGPRQQSRGYPRLQMNIPSSTALAALDRALRLCPTKAGITKQGGGALKIGPLDPMNGSHHRLDVEPLPDAEGGARPSADLRKTRRLSEHGGQT
jgi:hypothetical protein